MNKTQKQIDAVVEQYIEEQALVDIDLRRQINCARFDLYFGPYEAGFEPDSDGFAYLGFCAVIDAMRKAFSDIGTLWVDLDCASWSNREPEGETVDGEWQEPCLENTYQLDRRNILNSYLGNELASYV